MYEKVSVSMRDVLIDHLDGTPVPVVVASSATGLEAHRRASRWRTTKILMARGLLKTDQAMRFTTITEPGRTVLAAMLADYADALVRAAEAEPDFREPLKLQGILCTSKGVLTPGIEIAKSTTSSERTALTTASYTSPANEQ